MAGNTKEKRNVGRPKSDNPKMRFDLRLKTSTIVDIETVAEKLKISNSLFVQTILENEMEKYKNFLKI